MVRVFFVHAFLVSSNYRLQSNAWDSISLTMATTYTSNGIVFSVLTEGYFVEDSTSPSATTTTEDDFDYGSTATEPYTGTCATPMMTGDRPWWARSGYDPYGCGTSLITLNWTIFCCNGNVIDLTQALDKNAGTGDSSEMCFENMRCCSGDPALTHGTATTCTVGTEASMLLDSSVSSEFYATISGSTTSESDPFSTITSGTASASPTNPSSTAPHEAPTLPLLAALFVFAAFFI
jgi:hypothetical protein